MSGNFPPDYFAPGYFAPDYFGGESEANPGAISAAIAGTSSVSASLTAAVTEVQRAGGGARRKKPEDEKYRPPLPIIQRQGLPSAYREKSQPVAAAPIPAAARITATVESIKAGALDQQRRNNQAAAALIVTLAALGMEAPEGEDNTPPDFAPSAKQKRAQVEAAMMVAIAAAMENELV